MNMNVAKPEVIALTDPSTANHQRLASGPQQWLELMFSLLEADKQDQALRYIGAGALHLAVQYPYFEQDSEPAVSGLTVLGERLTLTCGVQGSYWYNMHFSQADPRTHYLTGLDYIEPDTPPHSLYWTVPLAATDLDRNPGVESSLASIAQQAAIVRSGFGPKADGHASHAAQIKNFSYF